MRFTFGIYYLPKAASDPAPALRKVLAIHRTLHLGTRADGPWLEAATPEIATFAPPSLESLEHAGRGLSKEQAQQVQDSQQVFALTFHAAAADALPTLRAAGRLAHDLAHTTGGLLWDEETRELFSLSAWRERRLDSWTGGLPHVPDHVTIHAYDDGGLNRAITLGMAKFGLPDVVAEDVPRSDTRPVGNLINLVCQTLLEHPRLEQPGRLPVDIAGLGDERMRKSLDAGKEGTPEGRAELAVAVGTADEGDPENRLLELTFAESGGTTLQERQAALIDRLFGSTDSITYSEHDAELLAASARAKVQLARLQPLFAKGLAPDERLLVKGPFPVADGGQEWMWIEVVSWTGGTIRGVLQNDPFHIPGLKAGAAVEVAQAAVFDYIHVLPDGRQEGNETGRLLEKRQGKAPDGQ